MKKSLFYILCLALMAGACMQDQNNLMIIGTCYDGIKNQDEKAIDCGGKCQSCLKSPCANTVADNELLYNNSRYRLGSTDYQSYQQGNAYMFDVMLSWDEDLYITLGGSTPKEDKIYPISKSLKDGSATVIMKDENRTYTATTGNLYVTTRNGKVVIELCSVIVSNSPYQATFSGRIISQ